MNSSLVSTSLVKNSSKSLTSAVMNSCFSPVFPELGEQRVPISRPIILLAESSYPFPSFSSLYTKLQRKLPCKKDGQSDDRPDPRFPSLPKVLFGTDGEIALECGSGLCPPGPFDLAEKTGLLHVKRGRACLLSHWRSLISSVRGSPNSEPR